MKQAIALVALFLILHALGTYCFPAHGMAVSYFFCLSGPVIAIVGCFRIGRQTGPATAWKWTAVCGGLLLWETGLAVAAWQDLLRENTYMVTAGGGFAYFLYGVPLLLAICAAPNDKRLPAVIWIDGILALAIGVLAYREIFSYLPGMNQPEQWPAVTRVAYAYDAENVLLALLAGVRLLAADSAEEQSLYRTLCGFLWVYSIEAGFYNHVVAIRWQLDTGTPWDPMTVLPFLMLAAITFLAPVHPLQRPSYVSRSAVRMIQAGISVSLPLVLLTLGVIAIGHLPVLGAISIVGSLAAYGLRNMLSQAQLLESEDQLLESRKVLERASLIDPLTGVGNRRAFDQTLEREWSRAQRAGESLALVLIDVDHFKKMNDAFGHQRGDECLAAVARALERALPRVTDFIARYGGEEFACILPATDGNGAVRVAEQLRAAVETLRIEHPANELGILTVSLGATACRDASGAALPTLVRTADRALYEAKRKGRNRVELALTESGIPALRVVS
ncbi:MAG: GGDEF domain-containing protein [Steroidobacteraceae bacterium]